MKIGLLITSIGNFGQKGFYNAQEIGLAKELNKLFDEVIIYKAVSKSATAEAIQLEGCQHIALRLIPCRSCGINGMINISVLDKSLDAIVHFSDTQMIVPKVYKWCQKNGIKMLSYIGVTESHSTNRLKKLIIDFLFKRNIVVYKRCTCIVKTPEVQEKLKSYGVNHCVVAPVGLDLSILHTDYADTSVAQLRKKWGYADDEKVLLFIGRLMAEKQPIELIDIFDKVRKKDGTFRLLIVGKGELREEVQQTVKNKGLSNFVRLVDQVPNAEIWELYRIAYTFVNLNRQEIFGMAILEAMYYECKVVAIHAPGPDFIIENKINGYLVTINDEVVNEILNEKQDISLASQKRVLEHFTWKATANIIYEIAGE